MKEERYKEWNDEGILLNKYPKEKLIHEPK